MEIEQQSNFHSKINTVIEHPDAEFLDALEEFPFIDASNSFEEPQQSSSSSDPDIKEDESTDTVISEHTPNSPSSPSAAGLRHRRLVFPRNCNQLSQSWFFKNNPEGLADFDPTGTIKRSCSLKGNEKLSEKSSSDSHESSAITSVSDDDQVNDESTTVADPLYILAELVIDVIGFQAKLLAKSVNFSIWLIHSLYMLLKDPYGVIKDVRNYIQESISGIWRICYNSCVKLINWFQTHESALTWCVRIGWGLLWLAYCSFILVCLIVPAFVFSGIVVKWMVEEPIHITEQLTFDYTKDTPTAFVPVIYCPDSYSVMHNERSKIVSLDESRVVPFGHELKTTVSLSLPESDYNRNLGIFQVRVDFLSSDGNLLASKMKPCMLQYKSEPIRLLSTLVKFNHYLTGYPSETQTLDIMFSGYAEKDVPLSCLRVVIEQRAEFAKGGGVPEIYSASLKLESQFPLLKRLLWYSKGLMYMWISVMMFITELVFTLFCCTPVLFPWVRRASGSSVNNAAHNMLPG